jgi:hypothetical protein
MPISLRVISRNARSRFFTKIKATLTNSVFGNEPEFAGPYAHDSKIALGGDAEVDVEVSGDAAAGLRVNAAKIVPVLHTKRAVISQRLKLVAREVCPDHIKHLDRTLGHHRFSFRNQDIVIILVRNLAAGFDSYHVRETGA